jgi:hypothetical protein
MRNLFGNLFGVKIKEESYLGFISRTKVELKRCNLDSVRKLEHAAYCDFEVTQGARRFAIICCPGELSELYLKDIHLRLQNSWYKWRSVAMLLETTPPMGARDRCSQLGITLLELRQLVGYFGERPAGRSQVN